MKISVLDPGLRNATGHHMALLDYFVEHLDQQDVIEYYCSSDFDTNNVNAASYTSKIPIIPTFSGKFYQHYNKDLKYTDANESVLLLSEEYYQTMRNLGEQSKRVNILLPTLLWEHALAFSQALQRYKLSSPGVEINIIALLMFNPAGFGAIGNGRLKLNFTMAFQALAKHSEIQFYAGDQEAMEEYQQIFGPLLPISLHPCFLVSQANKYKKMSKTYVIGYLGDAKVEKGFLLLPDLVDQHMRSKTQHTLLIHYTLESDNPELRAVERRLVSKVASHDNIEITKGYLSNERMHDFLANSEEIILNYDESAYKNKTSGIVWLAVRHAIAITCSRKTWMWREYLRLTHPHDELTDCPPTDGSDRKALTSGYAHKIFAPFVPWLLSKCMETKPCSDAT